MGQDISELKAAIRKRYPYSYSGIHQNDAMKSGPPCSPTDLLTVLCIQSQGCLNLPTELEQLQCAILNCSSFDKLSQECSTCVAVAGTSFSDVQTTCITSPYAFNSDGLVLFSKQPMLEIKRTEFHPGFVQLKLTSYIQAKVTIVRIRQKNMPLHVQITTTKCPGPNHNHERFMYKSQFLGQTKTYRYMSKWSMYKSQPKKVHVQIKTKIIP